MKYSLRSFRFTIRELLLLTVIVAVCAAWWADRSRLAAAFGELKYYLLTEEAGKLRQGNRALPVLPANVKKLLND